MLCHLLFNLQSACNHYCLYVTSLCNQCLLPLYSKEKIPAPPVTEWSSDEVALWMADNHFVQYAKLFLEKMVDGNQLLTLSNTQLKVCALSFPPLKHTRVLLYLVDLHLYTIVNKYS